jgi:energy-coupling factor transport system ATP-binding protein
MRDAAVSFENISFKYPNETNYAIKNVSFYVQKGEWLAIVGHNGSGKSTIAKLLNGLLKSESGSIKVFDIELDETTVWDIRKRVGMVFQNPDNQFVGTTVQDDVAFGLENNGIPRDEMAKRVNEAIRLVKMEEFLEQEPHHLSGGQKQRVAIAGIIALQPDIIILDEATSMLDPKGRNEVLETVRELKKKQNITVISITHDLEEVVKADRVIVMNKGKVLTEGTPEEVFLLGEQLEKIGLDLPFAIKLSHHLKRAGFPLTINHLTAEGLVDELWTLYSKM